MNHFAGMRVFVSRPSTKIVQRTWRERILDRPWVNEKLVLVPAAVPPDECYRVGNDLHCGEIFYEQLKSLSKDVRPCQSTIAFSRS